MARNILKSAAKKILDPVLEIYWRRRRSAELSAERRHVSKDEIVQGLRSLPLRDGAPVLVHSSLKSLGFVEGGADTVLDAMIEVVVDLRGGTLVLPTYSIDGTMAKTLRSGQPFDARTTPSNLGRLPESFRAHAGVHRSVHPTHSFGALGKDAQYIVEGQLDSPLGFGPDTPMMRIKALDGHLLGLGTTVGTVTLYHCLEDNEPFPFQVYTDDSPFELEVIDAEGRTHRRSYAAHTGELIYRIDRPNSETLRAIYLKHFEREGGLTWHRVAEADCWLMDAARLYSVAGALRDTGLTIYSSPDQAEAAMAEEK